MAKNVIIILDEYDTPMQAAWLSGYWEEAVSFFCTLFGSTFKNNPYLSKGLITGITRVAKESIFSSMNNPDVITTTSNEYARYFGFLEEEVFAALDEAGLGSERQSVKSGMTALPLASTQISIIRGRLLRFSEKMANMTHTGQIQALMS